MNRRALIGVCGSVFGLSATIAPGATITVPINSAQSSVTAQICISTSCGSDTSPVGGFFEIDVDDVDSIGSVTLFDNRVELLEPLNIVVSFGILGRLTVNVNDLKIFKADPGVAAGPAPVTAGAFALPGVLTLQTGTFDYTATGIVCSLLQGQVPPVPCTGFSDLSTQPASSTTFDGTLTSAARVVTLVASINRSGPIDPANPGLGTLTVTGTVRGSVLVPVPPCPGDLNADGIVNTADLAAFLGQFGTAVPPGTGADLTGDGIVNTADLAAFLGRFGSTCPDH